MSWLANVWGGVWADNPVTGRVIVVAILALTVVAVVRAGQHLARYRREGTALGQVVRRLAEQSQARVALEPASEVPEGGEGVVGGGGSQAPAREGDPQGLEPAIALSRLREGVDGESLIGERLAALAAFIERRVRISPETLQQLTAARDEARPGLSLVGFTAGLALLLGLLGTFVGLAAMVQEIHLGLPDTGSSVTLDTWSDSIEQLRGVLGGMKTAFSTSLVGMLCSILCACLDFGLRSRQASFFERLERFTTEELLPATVPAVYHENLLEQVSYQLERSFGRLEEIYEQNRMTLKDLSAVEAAFAEIVEEIRTITRGEAARDLERVIEQLAEINRAVLGVVDHLPRVIANSERNSREVLARIEGALAAQRSLTPPVAPTLTPKLLWLSLLVIGAVVALSLL